MSSSSNFDAALFMQMRAVHEKGEHLLSVFCCQYLQRLDISLLKWPTEELLCIYDLQIWLYDVIEESMRNRPYPSYDRRFLKLLVGKIEAAVQNTEEPDIYDPLVTACTTLYLQPLPPGPELAQRDVWIRYTIPDSPSPSPPLTTSPTIDILEKPTLLSGASCTGHRTWEACLRLATFLCLPQHAQRYVRRKRVLELGAGTGLLSLVCGGILGADRVLATDGDEEAVRRLESIGRGKERGREGQMEYEVFWWGEGCVRGEWDLVVAADVTYEPTSIPALVKTLHDILTARPTTDVLLSATVRNEETFKVFTDACDGYGLHCSLDTFPDSEVVPFEAQTGLFHAGSVPIKVVVVALR